MDIPGYWYDPDKNRYYRITNNPSMSSLVKPSVSKRSPVKSNSTSSKRRKTYSKFTSSQSSTHTQNSLGSRLTERLCQLTAVGNCSSINELLQYREYGISQSRRLMYSGIPGLLNSSVQLYDFNHCVIKHIAIHPTNEIIAVCVSHESRDFLYTFDLCTNSWEASNPILSIERRNPLGFTGRLEGVTDMKFLCGGEEDMLAFSSIRTQPNSRFAGATIHRLFDNDGGGECHEYSIDECFGFSWNPRMNLMAFGEGKQVWVVSDWVEDYYNHPNAGVSEYFATDSDVLCTQFGTKTPCVMCGTRNGKIILWDIRELRGHAPPTIMLQVHKRVGNSVTCLNVLRDENYLISTSANGTVLEWDLRMRRVVMPFSHGVVDESSFFYTKSCVDSKEMFLTSASQSSINMWSLLNGHKLQSVPVLADSHHLPAVCFTHHYSGGNRYCPVLIAGIGSSLKAYSVTS
ncbi:DDB1- and CUL4-associated factor 4-like [Dysidea avara]|uniref:DDB1- and CUL4-associated factor 4-like n=1 Tax=Dysidea avara TaxID=196820 RepID=UPI00332B4C81